MQGRVLVVDDEKAMLLALKGLLGKEGYHVETAGSGEEALQRIETGCFHVVITDLSMNGVGGTTAGSWSRCRACSASSRSSGRAPRCGGSSRRSTRSPTRT